MSTMTTQEAAHILTNTTALTPQEAAHVLANLKNFIQYLDTRPPNETELEKGVPIDFRVKTHTRKDGGQYKTYISPDGRHHRSIASVKRLKSQPLD